MPILENHNSDAFSTYHLRGGVVVLIINTGITSKCNSANRKNNPTYYKRGYQLQCMFIITFKRQKQYIVMLFLRENCTRTMKSNTTVIIRI